MKLNIELFWRNSLRRQSIVWMWRFLSTPYGWILQLRNFFYNQGWLVQKLPRPVISIGNLSLGGSGKTTWVMQCLAHLQRKNLKVALLARGYKRRSQEAVLLVSDGQKIFASVNDSGDEAQMVAQQFPLATIVLSSNRFKAGQKALTVSNPDIFILDDAFQHRALHRDLDIVLLDDQTLNYPHLFPSGYLREDATGIARADFVLIQSQSSLTDFRRKFQQKLKFDLTLPCALWRYQIQADCLEKLKNKRWVAFCAIGQPDNFFNMLRQQGVHIVAQQTWPDHTYYAAAHLEQLKLLANAYNAQLCTTQKDAVKLPPDFACQVVKADVQWVQGQQEFFETLESIL